MLSSPGVLPLAWYGVRSMTKFPNEWPFLPDRECRHESRVLFLGSQRLGEAGQAKFRGTVGGSIRPAAFACHGGDVDDGSSPRLAHVGKNGLRQQEGRTQVHIQDVVPIARGKLGDSSWDITPRRIDQDVN